MTDVLGGEEGHRNRPGKSAMWEQTDWNDVSKSQRTPRTASKPQKLEAGRKDPPLQLLEGAWPHLEIWTCDRPNAGTDLFTLHTGRCFVLAAVGKHPTPSAISPPDPGTSSSWLPSSGPGRTLDFGRQVTSPGDKGRVIPHVNQECPQHAWF